MEFPVVSGPFGRDLVANSRSTPQKGMGLAHFQMAVAQKAGTQSGNMDQNLRNPRNPSWFK